MLPTRSLPDPLLPLLPLRPQTPFARPDTAFTCSETDVGISRGRYSARRADPGLPLSFVFLCPPHAHTALASQSVRFSDVAQLLSLAGGFALSWTRSS